MQKKWAKDLSINDIINFYNVLIPHFFYDTVFLLLSVTVSAESIGIGAEIFLGKTETCFQILIIFLYFLGDTSFYKLENKPSPSKIIEKYLMFGRKNFRGPFMMEKNTSYYW